MEYIEHIVDYQPKHYKHYLCDCEKIVGNHKDINGWIRNLSIKDNLIWIKIGKNMGNSDKRFFKESAILTTVAITLFMLELEIDSSEIELSNNDINNILTRFNKINKIEYAYKKGIIKRNGFVHTLLKNTD